MTDTQALFSWFAAHGGTCDTSALGLRSFEGYGQGAVALRSLPEGHVLFSIPRQLTLSTRTSALPALLGPPAWHKHDLHSGWAGLILCMMWEQAQGRASKWSDYLDSLPASFDTPMFWPEDDLQELRGTSVVEKIGKDGAEKDYREKVVPVLEGRPDIFGPQPPSRFYSLENYHLMGSRILSRSFNVEKWDGDEEEEEETNEQPSTDMDVDEDPSAQKSDPEEPAEAQETSLVDDGDGDDDSDDDGEDADSSDLAMVPMADMLNARYGSENAKLFYEKHELRMVTTKAIAQGEQIWNTYGDPPNSHLLRCYGHVDLIPLPGGIHGNPADIVELRADLLVQSVSQLYASADRSPTERVDWWLEEGGEDLFIIDTSYDVPDELISFARLLLMEAPEWNEAKSKRKLPKAKVDENVLTVAADVLQKRIAEYPTTLEEDEFLLSEREVPKVSLNKRHSVIVRLGEKRILQNAMGKVQAKLGAARSGRSNKKRTADENGEPSRKKQKARR